MARSDAALGAGGDDLGQLGELLERLALGDALGAEGDVDVDAEPGDERALPPR